MKLLAKIVIIKILSNSSVKPGVPGEKPQLAKLRADYFNVSLFVLEVAFMPCYEILFSKLEL